MSSSTVLGVAVLMSLLVPGYAWVSYVEGRHMRTARSGVLDAVDVLVVGALALGAAGLIVAGLGEAIWVLPGLSQIVADDGRYITEHPWEIAWSYILVVALASLMAAIGARRRYKGEPISIHVESVWRRVFHDDLASDSPEVTRKRRAARVAVILGSGDTVEGYVVSYSMSNDGNGDIALQPPIVVRFANDKTVPVVQQSDVFIIPESEIRAISVLYVDDPLAYSEA